MAHSEVCLGLINGSSAQAGGEQYFHKEGLSLHVRNGGGKEERSWNLETWLIGIWTGRDREQNEGSQ